MTIAWIDPPDRPQTWIDVVTTITHLPAYVALTSHDQQCVIDHLRLACNMRQRRDRALGAPCDERCIEGFQEGTRQCRHGRDHIASVLTRT